MKFLDIMKHCLTILVSFAAASFLTAAEESRAMVIIVSEPGNPAYQTEFQRQAEAWQATAEKGGMEVKTIGLGESPPEGDRPEVEKAIADFPKTGGDLWLIWIGHGSFDGRTANFNLRGPDIGSEDVGKLLEPFERRLVILNLFSASGPFLNTLSKPNRVIVSATRGGEKNYSRFGEKFADSLDSAEADLDLDGAISLLEATLHASAATKVFYDDAQRVVQEHATIDDNGDGRATSAADFKGLRADGPAADGALARDLFFTRSTVDPLPPEARAEREEIEAAITALRKRKPELTEDDYYGQLEILMRKMAALYGRSR